MNEIVTNGQPNIAIYVPEETQPLIKASLSENTLKAYQRALQRLTNWLSGQTLTDALLAGYITELHERGKSPATIAQAVAAVKWQLKHQSLDTLNLPITQATLSGGRRGGCGQVDGLICQDVERVCLLAEMEDSLSGLRDAEMIRLMSDCLLRISEVVAVDVAVDISSPRDSTHILQGGLSRSVRRMRVLKVSSPGIRFGLDLLSRSRRLEIFRDARTLCKSRVSRAGCN